MMTPLLAAMLRDLGVPAVAVGDGKPQPAEEPKANLTEGREATAEPKAEKKLTANVIAWIRSKVGNEGLDVAKLGHLADLVASGAVSPGGLAGVLSRVDLAIGLSRFAGRTDADVIQLFWSSVERLSGYVAPAEQAADVQSAVKAFNDMVHAEFARLEKGPLPAVRHECTTSDLCKQMQLEVMAMVAAQFYHIAAHADELFVKSN